MQPAPRCPYVFLLNAGRIVGTGKLFFQSGTTEPAETIHGHSLHLFANEGEKLVAIWCVQIYQEFEKDTYPYNFGGLDGPPSTLGDMNQVSKAFKTVIAWEEGLLQENREGSELGNQPRCIRAPRQKFAECESENEDSSEEESSSPGWKPKRRGVKRAANVESFLTTDVPAKKHTKTSAVVNRSTSVINNSGGGLEETFDPSSEDHIEAPEYPGERSPATSFGQLHNRVEEFEETMLAKRAYRFKVRNMRPSAKLSDLRKARLHISNRNDNPFDEPRKCCKLRQCFVHADSIYAFAQYRIFMRMNREERKRQLIGMLNRDTSEFEFNGSAVCRRFLARGFGFSNCLQESVLATPKARASCSAVALPRDFRGDTKRDSVVTFLKRIAEETGDKMPARPHINLPVMNREHLWREFCEHFVKHDSFGKRTSPPTFSYFCQIWKNWCPHIKTHRNHGFTVCPRCEMLRRKMSDHLQDAKMLSVLRDQLSTHLNMAKIERQGYTSRRELAIRHPDKYCSIILDGADQKSYGLPHFIFATKSDRGHKIKVKCIGVLEHLRQKQLSLFTMTEEFASGANHIIETTHRVLQKKKQIMGKLPEVLFVQADNCTRENKNRYFMAYFELLVARGVFREVQISFLPIGHTHSDIDQSFSSVAVRLKMQDAITMHDLLSVLRKCYQPKACSSELLRVANFSGLCETSKCLRKVSHFSQFRYFKFSPMKSEPSNGILPTTCEVKVQETEQWAPLDRKSQLGFLKYVPDLKDTPPTIVVPPPNVTEVNKCLSSVEERIENRENVESLKELRGRVYTSRTDNFHWILNESFEMNGQYLSTATRSPIEDDSESEESGSEVGDYAYMPNDYVVTRCSDRAIPFWIGKVLDVVDFDERNRPRHLSLRWYIARGGDEDPFEARYVPADVVQNEERVPYVRKVHVNTILVKFSAFRARNYLRTNVISAIKTVLDKN